MKKKVVSLLCVLVLLVSALAVGSAVSAANNIGNLEVGYAKISIDPIDKEGTFRKVDYTDVWKDDGNAALKEKLEAAGITATNPYYTVSTLQVDCNNDGNTDDGYFSVPLAGYGSTDGRLSTGKMDDNGDGVIDSKDGNFITCIAITDEKGQTVLFFSLDLINSSDYASYEIRDDIQSALLAASYDVPGSSMYFSASHTHSSPDTAVNNSFALPINAAQRAYDKLIIEKTKEVAIAALEDRSEVTVSSGEVEATNMNATRHYSASEQKYDKNGTLVTSASWTHGDNFGGPMPSDDYVQNGSSSYTSGDYTYKVSAGNVSEADETLHLVQFTPKNGDQPIVMVNFRAHPKLNSTSSTSYGLDNRPCSSGDYAVMLREKLQHHGYRASFIQGAAGNQNT